MKSKHVLNIKHGKKCICTLRYFVQYTITSCCITGLSYIIIMGTVLYYHCTVLNSMFARLETDYEIRNQWFFTILEAMTTD